MSEASKKAELSQEQLPSAPEWVTKAQAHFASTGSYRPSDIQRLLGDQKQSIEVSPKTEDFKQRNE